MDLILDVNIQIYPVDLGKECTFVVVSIHKVKDCVCLHRILNSICNGIGVTNQVVFHSSQSKFAALESK